MKHIIVAAAIFLSIQTGATILFTRNVYAAAPAEYDEQNDNTCQNGVCSLPKHNSNDDSDE